jgi:ATP-dependent helicase/nuclease subunit A
LIVTGATSKPDKLLTECRLLSEIATPDTAYLFHEQSGYLPWILIAAGRKYSPTLITATACDENEASAPITAEIPPLDEERIAQLTEEYRRRIAYVYPREAAASLPAKLSVSELYPTILDDYDDAAKLSDTRKRRMRLPRFHQAEQDSAADRGTATHQFMQFCDFAKLKDGDVEGEISRLVQMRYLDSHTASLIDRTMLTRFLESDLYRTLGSASALRRELRFNIRLPAAAFTEDPASKVALRNDSILVQGIMDCVFTDRDGRLTILDYKTDRIPYEMRGDMEAFKKLLIQRHSEQLSYYRAACTAMMCRPVERILLYAFAIGEAIEVPFDALRVL